MIDQEYLKNNQHSAVKLPDIYQRRKTFELLDPEKVKKTYKDNINMTPHIKDGREMLSEETLQSEARTQENSQHKKQRNGEYDSPKEDRSNTNKTQGSESGGKTTGGKKQPSKHLKKSIV